MRSFAFVFAFALLFTSCFAMYDGKTGPIILNDSNFDELVLKSGEVWMVEFYAPWCGHCKAMKDDYIKAANAMSGIARFGAVDATEEKQLAQKYNIQGFPTVYIFNPADKEPQQYQGQRDAKSFCNAAYKADKSLIRARLEGKVESKPQTASFQSQPKTETKKETPKKEKPQTIPEGNPEDVIVLTDDTFEEKVMDSADIWMVKFYAPWCGHCKALAPEWIKAATAMKGKVHFAEVDATVNTDLAGEYQIQGYPTIKVFKGGRKDEQSVSDYSSERTAAALVDFASKLYADYDFEVKNPIEVIEVHNQETFDSICGEKTCLLAFLPHIMDSGKEKRNEFIEVMKNISTKQPRGLFTYGWVEGGSQYDLEQELNLGFGYPAVVAVSKNKGKYSVAKGAFTEKSINVFINGLKSGRSRLSNLPTMKDLTDNAPWDGEDAKPIPEDEEEMDL
ncbi:hypothetical protein WA158_007913 [Blastocystis sp. Blastoise]